MTARPGMAPAPDIEALREALYRDGIVGMPGAFPISWADDLRVDFDRAFAAARTYPEGTISRGPNRYYFAVSPERIRPTSSRARFSSLCSWYETSRALTP